MPALPHYELYAPLFAHPEADFLERVQAAVAFTGGRYPDAAVEIERFAALLPGNGDRLSPEELTEVQEIFTRSFEVQAVVTLDVGYVAFGDDYKRAELLVNLTRELRDAGLEPGVELADHLSNILRLLARWDCDEARDEFVALLLHPALERMIGEFELDRTQVRNALYEKHYKTLIESSAQRGVIYRYALAALLEVIRADFSLSACEQPEKTSDFLRSLRRELEIEAKGEGERPSGRIP